MMWWRQRRRQNWLTVYRLIELLIWLVWLPFVLALGACQETAVMPSLGM